MGYYCCVPLCNSNSKRKNGISFHGFTKDKQLRMKWLQNIRRDVNSKTNPFRINHHTKICSLHFLKSDFKIASEKWRLKPTAVPTIFAWTGKKPNKNVINVPKFIPTSQTDEDETDLNEEPTERSINEDEANEIISDDLSDFKIEDAETITEQKLTDTSQDDKPSTSAQTSKEDSSADYRQMYITLLKENKYLKSELETLNYKYKDQEELYENLVVVNKTTQKENAELRHTVTILQACLKKTSIFHEPSTIYLAHPTLPRDEKLIIQQQQQFQQQYQQLLQHQHQIQLMQHRQLQQGYPTIQSKEKNVADLQKNIVNQQMKYFEMIQEQHLIQYKKQQKVDIEHHNMLQKLLEGSTNATEYEKSKKRRKTSHEDEEKKKQIEANTQGEKREDKQETKDETKTSNGGDVVKKQIIEESDTGEKLYNPEKVDIKDSKDSNMNNDNKKNKIINGKKVQSGLLDEKKSIENISS